MLGAALVAVAFASQDPLTLARAYKEGEKDAYQMQITANLAIGTAEMSMNLTQTVKKVYENGDADIESLVSDMRLLFGGNEMPTGQNAPAPAQLQRFDKYGRLVPSEGASDQNRGMMAQMSFLRYAMFTTDKPMTPGTTVEVDEKDEKAGTRAWGKITLERVEDGVATILSDLQMTTKQTGEKPIAMKFKSQVETASSKLRKVTGDVTNLPANEQGMQIDSIQINVQRVL